jgi:Protein of unknown function (DUF2628)
MTIYAVLAPRAQAGSAEPEPERFVFVKEGFCWPALYMTIPWLIWRGMWLVLVAYVVAVAAFFTVADRVPPPVAWTLLVLFGVLVGLEANNLRRWTLERRGYRFLGVATGDRKTEAEYRFYVAWTTGTAKAGRSDDGPETVAPKPVAPTPYGAGEIVGLFPMSGARP